MAQATDGKPRKPAVSQPPATRASMRRSGQLSGVQIVFAVILAVGLLLAINFSSRIASSRPLLDAYENVITEIQTLEAENTRLQQDFIFAESDAYVEQWARTSGKMIRPGERLVIPVPAGVSVEPTPIPQIFSEFDAGLPEPEPWQLWWSLFFDQTPPNIDGP